LQTQIEIQIIIQIPIARHHVPCNKVGRIKTADTLLRTWCPRKVCRFGETSERLGLG